MYACSEVLVADIEPLRQLQEPPGSESPPDDDFYVSAADLADRWSCSRDHVYRLDPEDLPYMNLGRHRRYAWSAVRAYEREQTEGC